MQGGPLPKPVGFRCCTSFSTEKSLRRTSADVASAGHAAQGPPQEPFVHVGTSAAVQTVQEFGAQLSSSAWISAHSADSAPTLFIVSCPQ